MVCVQHRNILPIYKMLRKIRHLFVGDFSACLWLLYWMEVQFGHKSFGFPCLNISFIFYSFYDFEKFHKKNLLI